MESSKENVERMTLTKKGRECREGRPDILIGLGVELENGHHKEVAEKEKDLGGSTTRMNKGAKREESLREKNERNWQIEVFEETNKGETSNLNEKEKI